MTDYYSGSGALKGERADLGYLISRWFEQFGVDEDSLYVALKATGRLPVGKAGRVTLPKKNWVNHPDVGNNLMRYRRFIGMPTPQADPTQIETINVDPVPHGLEVVWDEKDPVVRELLMHGGLSAVEEAKGLSSLNLMAQVLDISFLTPLAVSSTPFDATDRAAGASGWGTPATATPRADIGAAKANYGSSGLNSALVEYEYNEELRGVDDLTTFFGGNVGAGTLGDELLAQAWRSFGISNVFVCDSASPLGNKVVLYPLAASRDPLQGFCGLIRATMTQPGEDANGVVIKTRDLDYETHGVYASSDSDFAIVPSGGVRITGV